MWESFLLRKPEDPGSPAGRALEAAPGRGGGAPQATFTTGSASTPADAEHGQRPE